MNPTGAIADFIAVWHTAGRMRWRFVLLSLAVVAILFSLIVREEYRVLPRPPHVDYITSWRADRGAAEIRDSNIANQHRNIRLATEQAKRDLEVKNIYKAIGRASGMDVDAIERQAKAEDAASAAATAGHPIIKQP